MVKIKKRKGGKCRTFWGLTSPRLRQRYSVELQDGSVAYFSQNLRMNILNQSIEILGLVTHN